jgi:hypothetical protein
MELCSGIPLQKIFLTNSNWICFVALFFKRIRPAVLINVAKMLRCKTSLGFIKYVCPFGHSFKKVYLTCKSRFCPSCGKVATDNWIDKLQTNLPDIPYQHIVFTVPADLWKIIQANRAPALNLLFQCAKETLIEYCASRGLTPGIMDVCHTFGRDLKFNPHIHMLVSSGGLTVNRSQWKEINYFHHEIIKKLWRAKVLAAIRECIKSGTFKKYPAHIRALLERIYSSYKNWYVHIGKKLKNAKKAAKYIGRYTKRPPIATARISKFIDNEVTFWFQDHHTKQRITWTLPALEFIARLVPHIHDHHFRQIRYSGFLANRVRSELVAIIRSILNQPAPNRIQSPTWRDRVTQFLGRDPLTCSCGLAMVRSTAYYLPKEQLLRVPI